MNPIFFLEREERKREKKREEWEEREKKKEERGENIKMVRFSTKREK